MKGNIQKNYCNYSLETKTVRGASMKGVFSPGTEIKIAKGFYNCHSIERGNVIIYNFSGNENPIVKSIKAIPGDNFNLKEQEGGCVIEVNENILKNSTRESYLLGVKEYQILSLYEKDYQGKILPETYLILGDVASGSVDSTHFGLVSKKRILGKVVQ